MTQTNMRGSAQASLDAIAVQPSLSAALSAIEVGTMAMPSPIGDEAANLGVIPEAHACSDQVASASGRGDEHAVARPCDELKRQRVNECDRLCLTSG